MILRRPIWAVLLGGLLAAGLLFDPGVSAAGSVRVLARGTLTAPPGAVRPHGRFEIVAKGGRAGLLIVAAGLAPNTRHDAYAVWLDGGRPRPKLLGFVNPAVTRNGRLRTAGIVPAGVSRYHRLLITRETSPRPRTPGPIVLSGAIQARAGALLALAPVNRGRSCLIGNPHVLEKAALTAPAARSGRAARWRSSTSFNPTHRVDDQRAAGPQWAPATPTRWG